ncbi:MAG: putative solute:sodium symporter small subunit [Cellvibrionaceae bacterium]|jgi:putative solute:sodium symporter small subunit
MSFTKEKADAYWQANIKLVLKLLSIWFIVGFGCSILFVDLLNTIHIGGYKLGFWFAQQGSIYVFVILTFYYARRIGQIDREFGADEE